MIHFPVKDVVQVKGVPTSWPYATVVKASCVIKFAPNYLCQYWQYMYGIRKMAEILGASMAIVVPDLDPAYGSVITIQRDNLPHIPYPGRWEVPGGTQDIGESAVECVIRETYEEVGVVVPLEAIFWMGLYRSTIKKDAYNAYFVAQLEYRPELKLGSEGREAKYMKLGDFLCSGQVIQDHSDRLWDYIIRLQGAVYPDGDPCSDPFPRPTNLSVEEYSEVRRAALRKKPSSGDLALIA